MVHLICVIFLKETQGIANSMHSGSVGGILNPRLYENDWYYWKYSSEEWLWGNGSWEKQIVCNVGIWKKKGWKITPPMVMVGFGAFPSSGLWGPHPLPGQESLCHDVSGVVTSNGLYHSVPFRSHSGVTGSRIYSSLVFKCIWWIFIDEK